MDGEGWYSTANVLWLAAEKLRQMAAVIHALPG